ncbi:hypothetical protein P691DRAFT_808211 [Macrolepiota fuliginosa MF-IS2]|uniref:Uncharacterized protein n=1 Tax=Macrolepiota fuliginosa MF-IS2 TaxID=1400762 RepID=A0A9P5X5P6_9AGAR|nr:hypothetical protein P691DRAFT_808211 [Macrolepiota fuliginosa MF-IS2]
MLDSLDNLSITIQNYNTSTAFSLEPLSGLRSLCINWSYRDHWPKQSLISQISMLISRCPDLESFKFTSPYFRRPQPESGPPMSLGQILAGLSSLDMSLRLKQLVVIGIVVSPDDFLLRLRHFRYLEKLEIGWSSDPDLAIHFGEICAILHAEGIHLKDITGAIIHHPAIIRYLASYSGIERMVLRPSHPLDDSTQLVDQFFSSVLRQHRNSLRYLELGLNKNTAWSRLLGRDLMIEVERCQRLEELNCWVYVSLEDKRSNNTDILVSSSLSLFHALMISS